MISKNKLVYMVLDGRKVGKRQVKKVQEEIDRIMINLGYKKCWVFNGKWKLYYKERWWRKIFRLNVIEAVKQRLGG